MESSFDQGRCEWPSKANRHQPFYASHFCCCSPMTVVSFLYIFFYSKLFVRPSGQLERKKTLLFMSSTRAWREDTPVAEAVEEAFLNVCPWEENEIWHKLRKKISLFIVRDCDEQCSKVRSGLSGKEQGELMLKKLILRVEQLARMRWRSARRTRGYYYNQKSLKLAFPG